MVMRDIFSYRYAKNTAGLSPGGTFWRYLRRHGKVKWQGFNRKGRKGFLMWFKKA